MNFVTLVIFILLSNHYALSLIPSVRPESCSTSSFPHIRPRRDIIFTFVNAPFYGIILSGKDEAVAKSDSQGESLAPVIYKSGKPPIVPGVKPKSKDDTSGTRKDPNFLRSIADCKNQCENLQGQSRYGNLKSKEECLSDCQDICCQTYEQCTFAIVPRI